jgi:hypothetical protein
MTNIPAFVCMNKKNVITFRNPIRISNIAYDTKKAD